MAANSPLSSSHLPVALGPEHARTFGSYNIIRLIGQGSFASVYEARKQPLGKRVALKVLHPSLVRHTSSVRRFLQEARTAALVEHPNIVSMLDAGEVDGLPFLAMEYLEGESLQSRLARETKMRISDAIDVSVPIVSALGAAHQAGIVHRDVKPANIFLARPLGKTVVPKLLDFGIVKADDLSHAGGGTEPGGILGTPSFMSPEQLTDPSTVDGRSDQFAMACILYQLLTGQLLFGGNTIFLVVGAVLRTDVPPMRALRPDVPSELEGVLRRALSQRREDRFPDAATFEQALLPFASPRVRDHFWRERDVRVSADTRTELSIEIHTLSNEFLNLTVDPSTSEPPPGPATDPSPPPAPDSTDAPTASRRRVLSAVMGTVLIASAAAAITFVAMRKPNATGASDQLLASVTSVSSSSVSHVTAPSAPSASVSAGPSPSLSARDAAAPVVAPSVPSARSRPSSVPGPATTTHGVPRIPTTPRPSDTNF